MTIKKIMGALAVSMALAQVEKAQQTETGPLPIPYRAGPKILKMPPILYYPNTRNFPGSYARLTKYRNAKAKRRAGI